MKGKLTPILVTPKVEFNKEKNEIYTSIALLWGDFFRKSGLLPIVVSPEIDISEYAALNPAGAVLSGGGNLSSITPSKENEARDQLDRRVLEFCISRSLPVVGVCRGCQFISQRFGCDIVPIEGHIKSYHTLRLSEAGKRLFGASGDITVNSYHRYGIKWEGADEIEPLGLCKDRFLEAFRVKGMEVYGIIWHPEREASFKDFDLRFFQSVFSEKGAK